MDCSVYSVLVSILLFIGFGLFIYSTIRPIFNKGKISFMLVCLFFVFSEKNYAIKRKTSNILSLKKKDKNL